MTKFLLPALFTYLGLGAIGGGAVLVISPSGKLIGMPLSMLERSPFQSFLIPGLILLILLGLIPAALVFALIKKPGNILANKFNVYKDMHWSWTYCICIYINFWIHIQIAIIGGVHWLHSFYIVFAISIIFVALLHPVRELYRNPQS